MIPSSYARFLGGALRLLTIASCVTLLHASPAPGGPGKTVFNVATFGAKGNGNNDDRAAIQAALDAAKDAVQRADGTKDPLGAEVYFPEGVYVIGSTLHLDNSVGIELVGAGIALADVRAPGQTYHFESNPDNPSVYVNGPSTALVAAFLNPGPLLSFSGQINTKVRGMALYGCPGALFSGSSTYRNNCTALVSTSSFGWGNSFNKYEELNLQDAMKGFSLGGSSSDGNNDILTFERIGANLVDVVFQQQTPQSVGLLFHQITAASCKTIFDFDNAFNAGGCVSIDTVSLTSCGGTGAEDWCIKVAGQSNTGVYRFCNVRAETTTEQLLRSRGWGVTELVNYQDGRLYAATHPALVRVEGGSVLLAASECVPNANGNVGGFAPVVEFVNVAGWKRTFRARDCILPTVRPSDGSTSYLPDLVKNLTTIPPDSHYRFNTCDDRFVAPLPDGSSANSWQR